MAFVRSQRLLPCTAQCGCDKIPRELLPELIVWDFDEWNYNHREHLMPPQGITFKIPHQLSYRQQITLQSPGESVSNTYYYRVETLSEMSFKIAAILCENFVRRAFSLDRDFQVLNFHYRQFILAHTCLVQAFHWPPRLALWLLPRLPTSSRRVGIYPPEIHHNIYSYRFWFQFQKYLRLRC